MKDLSLFGVNDAKEGAAKQISAGVSICVDVSTIRGHVLHDSSSNVHYVFSVCFFQPQQLVVRVKPIDLPE